MSQKALLYMRFVLWEVVVPLGLEWEFMRAFGDAFLTKDAMEGTSHVRPVMEYFDHPSGWHIKVSVHESEESQLEQFCKDFFGSKDIEFRGTEVEVIEDTSVEVAPILQSSGELLTPEGRKSMCKRLTDARACYADSTLIDDRDTREVRSISYTTDGQTIFADGKAMTDTEAFVTLQQTCAIMMGVGGL